MKNTKSKQVHFRTYENEKKKIEEKAKLLGFSCTADLVRMCFYSGLPLVEKRAKKELEEKLKNM